MKSTIKLIPLIIIKIQNKSLLFNHYMNPLQQVNELTKPDQLDKLHEQYPNALFIVFFYTDRCPNCKILKPNYIYTQELLEKENFFKENIVIFTKVNTAMMPNLISKHSVMGVPTVIFLKNHYLVYRFSGVTDYDHLSQKIKNLVKELNI